MTCFKALRRPRAFIFLRFLLFSVLIIFLFEERRGDGNCSNHKHWRNWINSSKHVFCLRQSQPPFLLNHWLPLERFVIETNQAYLLVDKTCEDKFIFVSFTALQGSACFFVSSFSVVAILFLCAPFCFTAHYLPSPPPPFHKCKLEYTVLLLVSISDKLLMMYWTHFHALHDLTGVARLSVASFSLDSI